MLHSAQAPGEAERPATRLIEWGENMLGHSGTLSQTLPLIDEALLSPPARLPVDVLYINLSSCSALIVTAPCTAASINPLYPSSHQSIKTLTPLFFILSSQTLHSRTSWPLSPPPTLLFGHWAWPIISYPGPSEQRLPFLQGSAGSLSVHRLTALQWLSTLLRCVLPVSVTRGNRPPAWQRCSKALWA